MHSPLLTAALAVALGALGGCADPKPADPAPVEAEGPAAPSAATALPGAVLGTFDTDSTQCAERMTMARLVTTPDSLRFYYGYATVDSVVAQGAAYVVAATMYQTEGAVEVIPEPTTYRIEPTDGGLRLDATSTPADAMDLVRCAP